MRPPPLARSWLLPVTASLLMMSSLTMAAPAPAPVVSECDPIDDPKDCVAAKFDVANPKTPKCDPGFVLETIIEDITSTPLNFKATCYSKCHKKFHQHFCADSSTPLLSCATTDDRSNLKCKNPKQEFIVNGVTMIDGLTCVNTKGWVYYSNNGAKKVDFANQDHHIVSSCKDKPTVNIPADCDDSSFVEDCDDCTINPKYDSPTGKLTCPAGKLVVSGSKVFDHAECTAAVGWKGNDGSELIKFTGAARPKKLLVKCHKFECNDELFGCPVDRPDCTPPKLTGSTLKCTNPAFLVINGKIHPQADCTVAGWKSGTTKLLEYKTSFPFEKLRAECRDCKSMFVNDCPAEFCTAKPEYTDTDNKLSCPAGHDLIVKGKVIDKPLKCSAAGWQLEGAANKLVDFSTKVEQLKARCVSQPVTSTPIATTEPVTTIATTEPTTTTITTTTMPNTTTTATTTTTTAATIKSAAQEGNSKMNTFCIIVIAVLILVILGILVFFYWYIRRNKGSDRDEEGLSKTKTKSDSKNNSTKKGKKGKKNNKSSKKGDKSKKGKKNKKEKESKKESKKAVELDNDVEMPAHEMSLPGDSTVPLTAALVTPKSPNRNVMDI